MAVQPLARLSALTDEARPDALAPHPSPQLQLIVFLIRARLARTTTLCLASREQRTNQRLESLLSYSLPRETATGTGSPRSRTGLGTGLTPVHAARPGPTSPLFGLHVGRVQHHTRDIQHAALGQGVEHRTVPPVLHSSPHPDRGLRHPETRRQRPPRTTTDQHVHGCGEHHLIGCRPLAATLRTHRDRRQKRLRDVPQPLRHDPRPLNPPMPLAPPDTPSRTRSYSRGPEPVPGTGVEPV